MSTTPLSPLPILDENQRSPSPIQSKLGTTQGNIDISLATDDYKENYHSSPSKKVANNHVDASSPRGDSIMRGLRSSSGFDGLSATPVKRPYGYHGLDGSSDERNKKSVSRREDSDFNIYTDVDEDAKNGETREEERLPEGARQEMGNSMTEENHNEDMSIMFHDETFDGKDSTDPIAEDTNDMTDGSHDNMDDTQLSTFSAVPNADMTAFAKLRESPTKSMRNALTSPIQQEDSQHGSATNQVTPSTAKKTRRTDALIDASSPVGSPTPRKIKGPTNPIDTGNLLDLSTDQIYFSPPRQPYGAQNSRYSPARGSPLRPAREPMRSPAKFSLLDFDIPPAPTPRSVPSVTPRELESLKSGFLSEISSLKATLSGREAEVTSLKQSIADAERRVGEALEEVRTESTRREALEIEQSEWVQRNKEMETVLRNVKADMIEGDGERERLTKKAEEAEKSKEQFEGKVVELESRLSAVRKSETSGAGDTRGETGCTKTTEETANEVQDAVEKVARELHVLYKGKHETKVAALKKSYEARWEKRVREAESKLKAALLEIDTLKAEQGSSVIRETVADGDPNSSVIAHANDEREAEKRVLEAQIKGFEQEIASVKQDSERVRAELNIERAEKGELVAAVDEWLAMQQNQQQEQQQQQQQQQSQSQSQRSTESPSSPQEEKPGRCESEPETAPTPAPKGPEHRQADNFQRSTGRGGVSGIRPPSGSALSGERKLGKYSGTPGRTTTHHTRANSGGKSGIAVYTPGRGGIMGSIERMGRGGV